MSFPTKLADLSITAASNSPSGSDSIGTSLDDFLRIIQAFERSLFDISTVFCPTVGGTADVVTLAPATLATLTAYKAGQGVLWIASGANTTAVTVNVNSLGAIALKKNVSSDLVAGDIPSGAIVRAVYDGTNFQISGLYIPDGSITTAKIVNNAVTNAKAAQMGANTIKLNNTGSAANATDGTMAQLCAMINAFTGFTAGAGTVTGADSPLTAIQKIVGNITAITNAPWLYTSAEVSVVQGAPVTFAHGLGRQPVDYKVVFVCKTAELGYAIGDEYEIADFVDHDVGGARGVSANVTNVYGGGNSTFMVSRTTGSYVSYTASSWRMKAYAR